MDSDIQSVLELFRAWRIELLLFALSIMLLAVFVLVIRLFSRLPAGSISFLGVRVAGFEQRLQHMEGAVKDELVRDRQQASTSARQLREELRLVLKDSDDALLRRMTENAGMQKDQLDSFSKQIMELTRLQEERSEALRHTVDTRLQDLQADNNRKLEQMRATVDEKLHDTLEKRLGESFRQVSERLEQVYKGLGEMRRLAVGVGDLKKVLTNVKTRGTWGKSDSGPFSSKS